MHDDSWQRSWSVVKQLAARGRLPVDVARGNDLPEKAHLRTPDNLQPEPECACSLPRTIMVSLYRTIRSMRRVGLKEWWRQLQYIGDAKSGTYKGKDQCVAFVA